MLAAALLVACGSSGGSLIPVANAGPLQSDFEAVALAAQSGDGNCTATEAALAKTELDFSALPASVDSGLRNTLQPGDREPARTARLALCAQPLAQTTHDAYHDDDEHHTTTTPTTTTTTTPDDDARPHHHDHAPRRQPTITTDDAQPARAAGPRARRNDKKARAGSEAAPNVGGVGPGGAESGK